MEEYKPKIYDCFTFFNELDLLEIRLKMLDDIVDYFLIVEADKNFSGSRKESLFLKNKKRFNKWIHKIRYLFVRMPDFNLVDKVIISLANSEKIPKFNTTSLGMNYISNLFGLGRWKLIFFQRDQIIKLLNNPNDRDIIIFSDLDEIPFIESRSWLERFDIKSKVLLFEHYTFVYYFNGFVYSNWMGTRVFSYELLKKMYKNKFSKVREDTFKKFMKGDKRILVLPKKGAHFTYIGDAESIDYKLRSVCECHKNIEKNRILENIKNGIYEEISGRRIKIKYIDTAPIFPEKLNKIIRKYPKLLNNINISYL